MWQRLCGDWSRAARLYVVSRAPARISICAVPVMCQHDTYNTRFRHGSDRTSIGFQGGTGSGLGNDVSQGFKTGLATPADAFRHGSDRTSIGFQGGIGSGLGEQGSQVIAPTWANPEDEFRFGVNSKAIDCKGGL